MSPNRIYILLELESILEDERHGYLYGDLL
jgi:hypothetical protein